MGEAGFRCVLHAPEIAWIRPRSWGVLPGINLLLFFLPRRHPRRDLLVLAPVRGGFGGFAGVLQMHGEGGKVGERLLVVGAFLVAGALEAVTDNLLVTRAASVRF